MQRVALDLLTKFGDTVSHEQLRTMEQDRRDGLQTDAENLTAYSNKHKALYIYAYRVIRPIWAMRVTNYASIANLKSQRFNLDYMLAVKTRLLNLRDLILRFEHSFVGQTCKNGELIAEHVGLSQQVLLTSQLDQALSEGIEVAERQSLAQLKVFIQRCLDTIEYFGFIEEQIAD